MAVYYIKKDGPVGPLESREVSDLIRIGVISGTTPVWASGMVQWEPFAQVGKERLLGSEAPSGEEALPDFEPVICAHSGQLIDRKSAIPYGDRYVMAEYKDDFVQTLSEGSDRPEELPAFSPPNSVWECWAKACRLASRNWLPLMLVWFLFFAAPNLLMAAFSNGLEFDSSLLEFLAEIILGSIGFALAFSLASRSWLGEQETISTALERGVGRTLSVIRVRVICLLATFAGLVIFVIPGIVIAARLMFAPALCFRKDGLRGMDAIYESWDLTSGRFLEITKIFLGFCILGFGLPGLLAFLPVFAGLTVLEDNRFFFLAVECFSTLMRIFGCLFLFSAMHYLDD